MENAYIRLTVFIKKEKGVQFLILKMFDEPAFGLYKYNANYCESYVYWTVHHCDS